MVKFDALVVPTNRHFAKKLSDENAEYVKSGKRLLFSRAYSLNSGAFKYFLAQELGLVDGIKHWKYSCPRQNHALIIRPIPPPLKVVLRVYLA